MQKTNILQMEVPMRVQSPPSSPFLPSRQRPEEKRTGLIKTLVAFACHLLCWLPPAF